MKKYLFLIFSTLFIGSILLYAQDKTEKTKKPFNIQEFYEGSKKFENPNSFENQEILSNSMSEKELGLSQSNNAKNLRNEEFLKHIEEPKDRKMGKHFPKVEALEGGLEAFDGKGLNEFLKEKAIDWIGEAMVASQRVSCYVARSQSFYNYKCDLLETTFGGTQDNSQSPSEIRDKCKEECSRPSTCKLAEPRQEQEKDILLGHFEFSKNNPTPKEFKQVIKKNIEQLTFSIKGKGDLILNFEYTTYKDKDKRKIGEKERETITVTPAKDTIIKGKDDKERTIKKYLIKDYVIDFKLSISAKDPNSLKEKAIGIEDLKLTSKKVENWLCPNDSIKEKQGLLKVCRPSDVVEFMIKGEGIMEVCKSNGGDNEDGSYSTQELCENSCRIEGKCELVHPTLNQDSFFGFQEGCLTKDKSCTQELCTKARETLAPIINEWVYDARGNRTQTINNGVPVKGTIRPRILASQAIDYNQKVQEETKELARAKMFQEQTFVKTPPIGEERVTTYAAKHEGEKKPLKLLMKPSNTLYGLDNINYYVVIRAKTITPDWKMPKDYVSSYKSEYFYIADKFGNLIAFARQEEIGMEGSTLQYKTFDSNTKRWEEGTISKDTIAPAIKNYQNIYADVEKNKYFVEYEFWTPEEIKGKVSQHGGIPIRRKFYDMGGCANVTGDLNCESSAPSNNKDKETYKESARRFMERYGPKRMISEIYDQKDIKKERGIVYYAGDVNLETQVFTILTGEDLSYEKIYQMIQDKKIGEGEKLDNEHAVWNDGVTGSKKGIKTLLKGDQIIREGIENKILELYFAGNSKNLSLYADIKILEEDHGENGYFFLWEGSEGVKDRGENSIQNLEADENLEINGFRKELSPKGYKDYVVFENKDYSDKENLGLGFGYGTGKFNNDKDCKLFSNGSKEEHICLPWWKIEREYDKQEKREIKNDEIRNALKKTTVPMEGRKVNVCVTVDATANAIYNREKRILTCNRYYSKSISKECSKMYIRKDDSGKTEEQLFSECYVDNCALALKNNCIKRNTFEFNNPHLETWIKQDGMGGNFYELDASHLKVKGYSYECPATANIEINHKCTREDVVVMNPANCGDTTEVQQDALIKGKSGWIFCDKNKPQYEMNIDGTKGQIKGFLGKCPNGKVVTCAVNQLATITKTCSLPVMEEKEKKVVQSKVFQRGCQDVFVDIGAGQKDTFKDSKNCFRINSADDSRGGKHAIELRTNAKIPTMKLSAVNSENQKEETIFCKITGKHSKLKDCQPNTSPSGNFVIDARYDINGVSDILFVEQMGAVDDSYPELGKIDPKKDLFDFDHTFRFEKKNQYGYSGWMDGDNGVSKHSINRSFWDNPRQFAGQNFPNPEHRKSDLNFFSDATSFSTKGFKITMIPEVKDHYNFQFLTKECTRASKIHTHIYRWSMFTHYACDGGKPTIDLEIGRWWDDHIIHRNERALKVFKNSIAGLTILFPSVSRYEVTFYSSKGVLMTQEITPQQMKSYKIGELVNIGFGSKIITKRGQHIRDVLIPAKEKEINEEKKKHAEYEPIQRGISTVQKGVSRKGFQIAWHCNDADAKDRKGPKTCKWTHFHMHYHHAKCYGVNVFNGRDPQGWAETMNTDNFALGRYNPHAGIRANNNAYNIPLYPEFFAKLDQLTKELEDLKKELIEESVYSCSSDPFSPVGGGTHFQKSSPKDRKKTCQGTRNLDYIKDNSIYKIVITDLESGKTFTKELTFPMPYVNRIFYTYLKEVDRRAYRCCQEF